MSVNKQVWFIVDFTKEPALAFVFAKKLGLLKLGTNHFWSCIRIFLILAFTRYFEELQTNKWLNFENILTREIAEFKYSSCHFLKTLVPLFCTDIPAVQYKVCYLIFFVSFTSIKSTLSDICKVLTNTIIDVFWNQTIWQNFRCIITNTVNTKLFWRNSIAIGIFQTTVSTIKVAIHSVVFVITEPVTNQGFVTLWNKKTKDMFVLVALKLVKSFAEFHRLVNSKTEFSMFSLFDY